MAHGMLRSARWLRNHGVHLSFAGNGRGRDRVYVPPDGALTVLQAGRLLGVSGMRIYRMERRGEIRFNASAPVAMVPLAECRKARRLIRARTEREAT